MAEPTPPRRQPSPGPTLLLVCGAAMLYLVAASHFIVSCLAQIQQAVETTRLSYLPEVVRQQQAAVNAERLHRFATVVRYADDPSVRNQAALKVSVMALNSSPSQAAGSRVRLRSAAELVGELAVLRARQTELERARWQQRGQLIALREKALGKGDDASGVVVAALDALLADEGVPLPPQVRQGTDLPDTIRTHVAEGLRIRQESAALKSAIADRWAQCEQLVETATESIGSSACMSLDSLIQDLSGQVRDLQRLVAWLLALTLGVLLGVGYFLYRAVLRPHLVAEQETLLQTADEPGIPSDEE